MILDLVASIALEEPIAASREKFDKFYDRAAPESADLENALVAYGEERMKTEILGTFSVIDDMITQVSNAPYFLRNTFRPGSNNPVKSPFYALFMAMFDLVVRQEKSPDRAAELFTALNESGEVLTSPSHYATTEDRRRNINTIKGLIQDYFVDRQPSAFTSGAGLALQIENALRRSQIETARHEVKQGLVSLDESRMWNPQLTQRLVETAYGIANSGMSGDIFLGVADCASDARRVQALDGVSPIDVGRRYVVGVDREAAVLGISVEAYVRRVVEAFRNSDLSEPLKTQLLGQIDAVEFRGVTIVRISIPAQAEVSFVGQRCFTRESSETKEAIGPEILAVQARFGGRPLIRR